MGHNGFGEPRAQWELTRVHSIAQSDSPDGPLLYIAERPGVTVEPLRHTYSTLAVVAERLPTHRIALDFVTPLRIAEKGKFVDQITVESLFRALLRRVYDLSAQWCGEQPEGDLRGLLEHCVRQIDCHTVSLRRVVWNRLANRENKRVPFDGLQGRIVLEGDLTEARALLLAGEYLHIGKQTVFGMGRYRLDIRP